MMTRKIALLTGGSRGLGKSMALYLAEKKTDIILTYHSKEAEAQEVVELIKSKGGEAVALKLNTEEISSFANFVVEVSSVLRKKWGKEQFDYLINNAGIGISTSFAETTEDQFDKLMNIHFKGVYFLTQKLLPLIKDKGRILNISTCLTRFTFPGFTPYASMKGAIEVLTKYLAKELGPRKITVNVIAPGAIETDFGGGLIRDNKELNKHVASDTALGRVGLPDDIGGVVAAILSDDCGWINGQRIEVSGGMLL